MDGFERDEELLVVKIMGLGIVVTLLIKIAFLTLRAVLGRPVCVKGLGYACSKERMKHQMEVRR